MDKILYTIKKHRNSSYNPIMHTGCLVEIASVVTDQVVLVSIIKHSRTCINAHKHTRLINRNNLEADYGSELLYD